VRRIEASGYECAGTEKPAAYPPLGTLSQRPRQKASLVAIPYFAWANRGANAMRVWIPAAPT